MLYVCLPSIRLGPDDENRHRVNVKQFAENLPHSRRICLRPICERESQDRMSYIMGPPLIAVKPLCSQPVLPCMWSAFA